MVIYILYFALLAVLSYAIAPKKEKREFFKKRKKK